MSLDQSKTRRLSERDLDFLVDTVSPEVADKPHLKQIIREDEDFRNTFMGDAKVFHRVMRDDEILFILGVFPVYAERYHRYPVSGQIRPGISGRRRVSPQDYQKEGQRFYRMAAEHRTALDLELSEVFWALHENFQKAKKPLNFIAEHYLPYKSNVFLIQAAIPHFIK
jgi:hypothetical protein